MSNGTAPRRGDRIDEDQRVGRGVADRGSQLGDRVRDAGRRLVVGQQHRLEIPGPPAAARGLAGRWPPRPTRPELVDVGAVDLGDLREPVAEGADRDREDGVTRGERVDDGRLECAGAGTGEHDHVVLCAEVRLHALADADEERLELLAAVIDHLAPARLADGRGEGSGPGDPKVLLEAGHWARLLESREDAADPAPRGTDPSTVVDMTSYEDRPDHDPS